MASAMSRSSAEQQAATDPLVSQPTESSDEYEERTVAKRLAEELCEAAWTGSLANVRCTLAAVARLAEHGLCSSDVVDSIDENGETALSLAAARGHADVVVELLRAGADQQHTPPGTDLPIPMVRLSGARVRVRPGPCAPAVLRWSLRMCQI
jgi:ankyrin repeat protein